MALIPIPPSAPFVPKKYNNTYWVDPVNGSDSNTGNSIEKPWKTLTKAIGSGASGAANNSTIYLAPGTYTETAFTIYGLNYNIIGMNSANGNAVRINTALTTSNVATYQVFENITFDAVFINGGSGYNYFYGCTFNSNIAKSSNTSANFIDCLINSSIANFTAGVTNFTNSTVYNVNSTSATLNFYNCPFVRQYSLFITSTVSAYGTTFKSGNVGGTSFVTSGTGTVKLYNCVLTDGTGALNGINLPSGTTYTLDDVQYDKSLSTLNGTAATPQIWFNSLSAINFAAPANDINPIPYFDGTRLVTDSTLTNLGYNALTDTVYSGAIKISGATSATAWFTNTSAQSPTGGAGMSGFSDPGAAMTSGNRLGFYTLGGAVNSTNTTNSSSAIEAFATQNWSTGAAGSNLVFSTTENGGNTRATVLTLGQDKNAVFTGTLTAVTSATLTNTAAGSSTSGGILNLISNAAAATTNGNRLGLASFQGALNGTNTLNGSSTVEAFATENWATGAAGSNLVLSTTANGGTTRSSVLTLGQDKSAVFTGTIAAATTATIKNTSSGGPSGGSTLALVTDANVATTNGNRLGSTSFQGATNSANTLNTSSAIEAFATENWSGTAAGSNLLFTITRNGTRTRSTVLALNQDRSATFAGVVGAGTYYSLPRVALGNFSTSGTIGIASETVDVSMVITIAQTTANVSLTLPNPTALTTFRSITIENTGSVDFNINGTNVVSPSTHVTLQWNGSVWAPYCITWTGGTVSNAVTINNTLTTNFTGTGTGAVITATGTNTQGGNNYIDFLKVTNTGSAAININKFLRLGPTGALEVINSAYSATILSISDAGDFNVKNSVSVNGKIAVNGPAFAAYASSATQTIPSGIQTKVLFQTEEYDTNGNFASSRFTPTVEGYYQLNAAVRIDGPSSTGEYMLVLYKNGTEYKRGNNGSGTEIGASFYSMQVSSLAYANGTGDYFEIYIQQGSGSNKNVTAVNAQNITWFNGCMVRGA